jgi:MFS family permease
MGYVHDCLSPVPLLRSFKYDAGVLGGVLLHEPFLDAIGNPTGVYIIPMISSSYSLAACVTSFFVATFAFKIGRRGTIILGCVVAVIGSVIQSSAYSVAQLIVGRVCTVSAFIPK